ncbi:ABC transporter permease subunit [Bacillus sp. T33-2]|uniref:ABC transporter permease subunit n=1 Tax=Bacillus sp. T33-2 TaxID=2054168 RepID=UPI000C78285F|nr:ABC transporter permease subunit [Bacillus sp. T33-2]PLR99672.1 peptide ABC transporter permease [Bacillus sp. T33-2]
MGYRIKLIIGLLLLGFFFVIAVVGPAIAPYDVDYSKKIDYIETKEGEQLVSSPFPPSKDYIFGTDKWGYDILTLLLNGAKYTVFTVITIAFLRVLIGSGFGIYHALHSKLEIKTNKSISVFSAIPAFIIIYFIMVGINIEPVLSPLTLTAIQSILMIILGLAGVHRVTFEKAREIRKHLFIDASKTLGGSKLHILTKHIFPALKGNLLIIFINEIIQVLHLIGQLAIFDLFLGGTEVQYNPIIYLSITNEWAGLIGQSRTFLRHSQWIVLFPLLTFLLFLFAFYLLSQGLNEKQKAEHRKYPFL